MAGRQRIAIQAVGDTRVGTDVVNGHQTRKTIGTGRRTGRTRGHRIVGIVASTRVGAIVVGARTVVGIFVVSVFVVAVIVIISVVAIVVVAIVGFATLAGKTQFRLKVAENASVGSELGKLHANHLLRVVPAAAPPLRRTNLSGRFRPLRLAAP